ncbi:MAG: hypothetical protein NDI69_09130 [Bacteriovoracaceae bacterium]|nr:hypothetical protein [Bacteriovoracaceae bacterium]
MGIGPFLFNLKSLIRDLKEGKRLNKEFERLLELYQQNPDSLEVFELEKLINHLCSWNAIRPNPEFDKLVREVDSVLMRKKDPLYFLKKGA